MVGGGTLVSLSREPAGGWIVEWDVPSESRNELVEEEEEGILSLLLLLLLLLPLLFWDE